MDRKVNKISEISAERQSDSAIEGELSEGEIAVSKPQQNMIFEGSLQREDANGKSKGSENATLVENGDQGEEISTSRRVHKQRKTGKKIGLCKKWRFGKCSRKNCPYLHKDIKNGGTLKSSTNLVVEEKPKSLYTAVCSPKFLLTGEVASKSNGERKYCSIADIIAFSGAWIVGFSIGISEK